jgi:predicted alpha/beta superfamily hydrolase
MKKIYLILIYFHLFSITLIAQTYERYNEALDTTLFSSYLSYNKNISIIVPFEWQADSEEKYPLIIIFDSQNSRSHGYMINTIDYLTSNEQMPSAIIVSIKSDQEHRYIETSYLESVEVGKGLENELFLFDELIPFIEDHFNSSSFRLFIGHSRYGYFSTSLFCSHIDNLNAVISISPFFSQKNVNLCDSISIQMNREDLQSLKYYRYAIGNDYPSDFFEMDSVLATTHNALINAEGFYFPEADHNVTPGLIISKALYEIFEFWAKEQSIYIDNRQEDLTILDSLNANIIDHYGSPIRFSLGILNGKGWYFYNKGNYKKAIEAWEILLENYPDLSEFYLYIIDAQKQLNLDISTNVGEFEKNLESSKIYTEDEKNQLRLELAELLK